MGIYWEFMHLVPSVSFFNGLIRNSKEDIRRSFVAVSRKSLFNLEVAGHDIILLTFEGFTYFGLAVCVEYAINNPNLSACLGNQVADRM